MLPANIGDAVCPISDPIMILILYIYIYISIYTYMCVDLLVTHKIYNYIYI